MRALALVAIAMCLMAASLEAASVTRGPYLQLGSNNRITIRWRTDVATDTRVIYGITQGNFDIGSQQRELNYRT